MLEGFRHQEDYSDVDFSFVYELDEDSLNFFFEVTDVAIAAMIENIEENPNYVDEVSSERCLEIVNYFMKLLDLYTDYELYEECDELLIIIEAFQNRLEKDQEIVGNMK
jgi:hypothetical protein